MAMNAFCTVVTPSHLCWVLALAKSLKSSKNPQPLYVLLISEDSFNISLSDNIHICTLNQLTRKFPENIYWYFDSFELCNALKPFIVEWVFQQGFEKVIFLDSDLYVVGSFDLVWSSLDSNYLLLTPHHLSPPSLDLAYANEVAVADMGIFNGGFTAWRSGDVAADILEWMCTRFPVYGFCDRKRGMFVDQKLLPLLVQYFPNDVKILYNPSLNIAFWNCHERNVEDLNEVYFVGQEPVIFFHMSGFRLTKPHLPCSYLSERDNKTILSTAPWMVRLLEEYGSLLRSCSDNDFAARRPFSEFNGIKLIPSLRQILFKKGTLSRHDPEVLKAIVIEKLKKFKQYLFPYRHG